MPMQGPQDSQNVVGTAAKSQAFSDMVIITTEALATAAGAMYTHTHFNGNIDGDSIVLPSIQNGSNSQGDPSLGTVTPGTGQVVITIVNRHATLPFNGTLIISLVAHN